MDDVVQVSAGSDHTVAIKSDGTLWAFGENEYGQFGNGSLESEKNVTVPTRVLQLKKRHHIQVVPFPEPLFASARLLRILQMF